MATSWARRGAMASGLSGKVAAEGLSTVGKEAGSRRASLAACPRMLATLSASPECNDPTIGSYNHYHLSPNGIPRGNQRWYGLVYFIQIAGKPRIRPRQLLSSLEVLY